MHSRAKEIFIDYTSSFSEQKEEEEARASRRRGGPFVWALRPPPSPSYFRGK